MKRILVLSVSLALLAGHALAFGGDADANASAKAKASATAAAVAGSVAVNNTNVKNSNDSSAKASQRQSQSSTQANSQSSTISFTDKRQAPSVFAPSMSSGNPCTQTTSGGISIIGGGISGGASTLDPVCWLFQSGQIEAANHLLASESPKACRSMRATGVIAAESICGDEQPAQPVVSTNSGASSSRPKARPVLYSACEMRGDSVYIQHRWDTSDKAASRAQCLAALGY